MCGGVFRDSQYPHSSYLIVRADSLADAITELYQARPTAVVDLVVQPQLQLSVSGAILIKEQHILCEQVQGAPMSLLREGQLCLRSVYGYDGELISSVRGKQRSEWLWQDGGFNQNLSPNVLKTSPQQ